MLEANDPRIRPRCSRVSDAAVGVASRLSDIADAETARMISAWLYAKGA